MQITAPLLIVPSENSAERINQLNLKVSDTVADELGLKNTQVVHGAVSEDGKQIQLRTQDWRFLTLPFNGQSYRSASFWFRVEFTPYGIYLRPHSKEVISRAPGGKDLSQGITAAQTSKSSLQEELTKPLVESNLTSSYVAAHSSPWLSRGAYEFVRFQQLLTQSQLPLVAETMRGLLVKSKQISPNTVFEFLRMSGLFSSKSNNGRMNILELLDLIKKERANNYSINGVDEDVFETMSHRINTGQVETVLAREQGELHYRFVIMLEDQLPSEVVIFRHKEEAKGGRQQYGVELELNFKNGLPIKFSCLLVGEDRFSLSAWSCDKHVVALLLENEKALRASLRDHGIQLESFAIYESLPTSNEKYFVSNNAGSSVEYRV